MDDVKTSKIKVGGRTFDLAFSVAALIDLQEIIPDFNYDFEKIKENISNPKGMIDILYIFAKCGELVKDKELDVSKEWFAVHTPASRNGIIAIQVALIEAMTNAITMESEEDEDKTREVDVALQEIQKKREKTG